MILPKKPMVAVFFWIFGGQTAIEAMLLIGRVKAFIKQRLADRFLGGYLFDEPGGKQIDIDGKEKKGESINFVASIILLH
jgi:hypothetical protein